MLGPIPSTAWIPIVLIAFPSAVSASAFLIALAVWFPTTVLTSSGIASIPNSYFEVSSTLGAGSLYRIVMVGSISISGVSKHFINPTGERITALDNVSLEIPSGSFVSLIGPSGCGKSTLLRLISGLIPMDEGELTLDGVPVTAPGADRGFMFQEHTLFPWLSIYDNIAFGLRARGIYKQEKDRVDEFIEMVGLKGFEHSYPHQLSGGMCQRASLARALVGRPKVLLLDEPLGALDAFTRMNMQDEILRIWKETGMTAIMITHDVDEAVYLSDKVVVMTPRPGRITGTLDIRLSRPRAPAQSGRRSVRRTVHVFPLQKSESVKKSSPHRPELRRAFFLCVWNERLHHAAVFVIRLRRFAAIFSIRRRRNGTVSLHEAVVFHDKRARRVLIPGGIVFFHQIIVQLDPVSELDQPVRLPKRHLFDKIETAVPGRQQDAHVSDEQGIVRIREPVMEHHGDQPGSPFLKGNAALRPACPKGLDLFRRLRAVRSSHRRKQRTEF